MHHPPAHRPPRQRFEPREIDAEGADRALALARDAGIPLGEPGVEELVARVGAAAPAVLSALLAAPALAKTLARESAARGAVTPALIPPPERALADLSRGDDAGVKARLRRLRNEALARTAVRELYAHADVDRTAREWSQVAAGCTAADVDRTAREWSQVAAGCTAVALAAADAAVTARYGAPVDERGARVAFTVLGMGKLGGEELNLGSDIDICFFYATDDGAAGERTLNEYFGRVGALLSEYLEEVTAEGFAFRVDLRLRPEGSRGPLANSLASAERYYETWGRSWERAALLRARPVAGALVFGEALLDALRPFVFRRSVDPGIARDVLAMLERSRRELLREGARDLKLGPGGIREAEFFVQALQLVWGGLHRSLQVPGTLRAVSRLRALGLLSHRDAQSFGDAWALLRRLEHRVQVMAAYATHLLPDDPTRQRALARSLGYDSYDALGEALERARNTVSALTATLIPAPPPTGATTAGDDDVHAAAPAEPLLSAEAALADLVAAGAPREALAPRAREVLGVRSGDEAADDLVRLARRADFPLGAVSRDRFPLLGARLLAEVRDAPDPDRALAHLADLFGRLRAADTYAHRLAEAPDRARGLLGLFGASEALSKTLLARPDLLDAVVTGGAGAPSVDEITALVNAAVERAAREPGAADDPADAVVGALRRTQREVTLAVGLADMAGLFTAGEVARRLTALAEASLAQAFALAARESVERYGLRAGASDPLEGVAVFALGSLAARELGYGGDVDVIVLYDRDGETVGGRRAGVSFAEFVARTTQRAILFLSSPHAQGPGYAVDTRLRPSGSQGTLVVSLDAFTRYHERREERAEPGAASWERQALIRARLAAGDRAFGAQAAARVERIAYEQGAPDAGELVRLRERMERELGGERGGAVALKYGRGGTVDAEFAAQALQMVYGADARVRTPTTRRALAALRDAGHLDAATAEDLFAGEKLLRRALLAARLVSERSVLEPQSPAALTVARKLGYRDRAERGAEEALFADLAQARERVRRAFLTVVAALPSR